MITEAAELNTNRPYAPPSNVISLLHRLRSRNLPDRIDAEYLLDAGTPEGTVHRSLSAMRFLGLVHKDGEPTLTLRSLHTSTEEEYKAILSGAIRDAYGDVFAVVDPAEDSQERILNIFRRYTPASQRSRMVIFFLGVCREAGIPVLDVPRQRAMAAARGATPSIPRPAARGRAPRVRENAKLSDTPGVPPALEGLIRSLPPEGTPLSGERREQWLKMAEATLAFLYPEEKEEETIVTEDEGDEQP